MPPKTSTSDPKQIKFGVDAASRLVRGALRFAQAVRVTYGPGGRHVLLQRLGGLLPTKDGLTVGNELVWDDPIENMGCSMLKNACLAVNEKVGDGTTTTALLAASLIRQGYVHLAAGADMGPILKGLQTACTHTLNVLFGAAKDVPDQQTLERVAYVASNGDQDLAEKIAEACLAVGKDGSVVVQEGQTTGLEFILKEGLELDRGWSWDAVNTVEQRKEFNGVKEVIEGPVVAVVNKVLESKEDVQNLMEESSQFGRTVLVIADQIVGMASSILFLSNKHHPTTWRWIHTPGHTRQERLENLKDLAAMSGAHLINPVAGDSLTRFKTEWLGAFRKVDLWPHKAVVEAYEDKSGFIKLRVDELKAELKFAESDFDHDQIKSRIARLVGGLCTLKVGGFTESEIKEKYSRVEDALHATQAALGGGFVPGGGVTYLMLGRSLSGFRGVGWDMLSHALHEPIKQLIQNTGREPHTIVDCLKNWEGWDASIGQARMLDQPPQIIDPTEVVQESIRAACSVAVLILSAEATITRSR